MNEGRETVTLDVANTGDRPIQVGSHYHFFETNPALKFDRDKAKGFRLDIPAGTATRFEPGQTRHVRLVALAGKRTGDRVQGRRGDGRCEVLRARLSSKSPYIVSGKEIGSGPDVHASCHNGSRFRRIDAHEQGERHDPEFR